MCSSGVGFDPVIDGVRHTFEAAGLYNGLFVMSDRATGSVWTHYDGTVLQGPLAGQGIAMTIKPMAHTTWSLSTKTARAKTVKHNTIKTLTALPRTKS